MYCYARVPAAQPVAAVRLLGSGAILREVIAAAGQLANDWNVSCEVWSVTSFSELARDAAQAARWNRLHPLQQPRVSHLEQCLDGTTPIVAASDYVRAYPQLIAPYLTASYTALGTDGFGRSDTRAALRRFFEIDRQHVVVAALDAAARNGDVERGLAAQALERYGIDTELAAPWTR
jgi:pyruvate dehydrogenase E1 component